MRLDLPYRRTYYPLGSPVKIETNSHLVIEAANESWSDFPARFDFPASLLRIMVSEDDSPNGLTIPVFRAREHLMTITADSGNVAVCDFRANSGFCWLSANAAADRGYARYYFLEGMAYCLQESDHFTSLHAGCVARNGRGFLLWGHSGAGKSCLSFACARAGWLYLSDDATCLIRNRRDRLVVGMPHQVRFRDSAVEFFPELEGRTAFIRPSGAPSIELRTRELPHISTALTTHVDHILFLDRKPAGAPCLKRLPGAEALERLEAAVTLGDFNGVEERLASLAVLAEANAWTFLYSDLDPAVDALTALAMEE